MYWYQNINNVLLLLYTYLFFKLLTKLKKIRALLTFINVSILVP